MKAMISQPMKGLSDEEIAATRERAVKRLESEGYEVVNTWQKEAWLHTFDLENSGIRHVPLFFLSQALEIMSRCDLVYFCKGWEDNRGCRIEYDTARQYGVTQMFEEKAS